MIQTKKFHIPTLIALIAAAGALHAQKVTVLATGLKNPTKMIRTPGGSLLVTETDVTPNSGRLTLVTTGGVARPLIGGLPSGLAAPNGDPDGPSGIVLTGRVLFLEMGEGDGFSAGPKPGQLVPNPKGPSSPIFASILKFTLSADVEQVAGTFMLTAQNQSDLGYGKALTLTDGAGASAICEMVTEFRPGIADPNTIWRNSHPYAMTFIPTISDPVPNIFNPSALIPQATGTLYAADAGMNLVWQVDAVTGKTKALTQFAPTPDPLPGPPVIEAVPDSIQLYNGQLLVTLLSGAPFVGGQGRVMLVDPATGAQSLFIALLSSSIDVGYVPQATGRPVFYVLQYSTSLGTGGPGQLLRYDSTSPKVYVDNLKGPSSMTIDQTTGTLYIAERGAGDILMVTQ